MFEWTDQQIGGWVGMHLWPLFRIIAFLMAVPVFGTQLVPGRARLVLALLITILVVPSLPAVPAVDPLSLSAVVISIEQVFIVIHV